MSKKKSKIDGGFVVLPKNTLICKQWRDLRPTTKVVFVTLLTEFIRDRKMNPEHKVKMSQGQIEKASGLSHPTVVRGLKELKTTGFISVAQQGGLEWNYSIYYINGRYLY